MALLINTMAKYRKKPVIIEAWKWDETKETFKKTGCKSMMSSGHVERPNEMTSLRIQTLEGTMAVNKGDYIIKGVHGEFYPCKPDIFEKTYEKIFDTSKCFPEIKGYIFIDEGKDQTQNIKS